MRVLFDARRSVGRVTGIGRIIDGLLHALAKDDRCNQYLVLVGDHDPLAGVGAENFEVRHVHVPLNSPRTRIPAIARAWRADVAYFPFWFAPLTMPCPFVVGIHDLIQLFHPEEFSLAYRALFRTYVALVVRRARRIHALSAHGKVVLQRTLRVAPQRIDVVSPAVPDSIEDACAEQEGETGAATIPSAPFALYVGNHKPHKNLERLLQAYAGVMDRIQCDLVVAGARSSYNDPHSLPHQRTVEKLGVGARVHFAGQVSDAVLRGLYRNARFFVFPSLYEGFGIPCLEAMRCGTPVACSNTTSLPEVVGDAALMFDPLDVSAIGAALLRLDQSPNLRADLSRKGLERCREFSWPRSARGWLASMVKAAEC